MASGCAPQPPRAYDSVLPGTIGATVRQADGGVAVIALRPGGAAEGAGLRVGDVLRSYNGVPVTSRRQFHWLVVESSPGSTVTVTVQRSGHPETLRIPVDELDLTPGA